MTTLRRRIRTWLSTTDHVIPDGPPMFYGTDWHFGTVDGADWIVDGKPYRESSRRQVSDSVTEIAIQRVE